jgi:hypothetical protein
MKKIILLMVVSLCCSCQQPDTLRQITGDYFLIAIDSEEQLALSWQDPHGSMYFPIVESTVFAVGYDENYIVAKQHPKDLIDITNYFILPIKNVAADTSINGLIGPLTLHEFEQKRKELNLEQLKFTIVYKDLE